MGKSRNFFCNLEGENSLLISTRKYTTRIMNTCFPLLTGDVRSLPELKKASKNCSANTIHVIF